MVVKSSGRQSGLYDVIVNAGASVLIGTSGISGLFTEAVIKAMHDSCPTPIIFPLSNPSKLVEAHPADVLKWTKGQAIVATGSPLAGSTLRAAALRYPSAITVIFSGSA